MVSRVVKNLDWFRQIDIVDDRDQVLLTLDCGIMWLTEPPTTVEGVGTVIGFNDARMGKLGALLNRGAARDYADIDAMTSNGTWPRSEICEAVVGQFRDIGTHGLATQLRGVVDVRPWEWDILQMSPSDVADLTSRMRDFADWADKWESHHLLDPTTTSI